MSKFVVISKRRNKSGHEDPRCTAVNAVKICRPSFLGNPYYMDNEEDRSRVIESFRKHFYRKVESKDPIIMNELRRIRSIAKSYGTCYLVCWCKPKACHGDVIAEYLNSHTTE